MKSRTAGAAALVILVGACSSRPSSRLHSASNFGDVQRLANGNTVITYNASLQEVDASDALVLEVAGGGQFGYVEFRESLYGLPLDIEQ